MQLSKNFSFEELTSNHRGGALEARNIEVGKTLEETGRRLAVELLQPARDALGPLHVTSAMRYAEQVGGKWTGLDYEIRSSAQKKNYKPTSQHCRFEASDIVPGACSVRELWLWYKEHSTLPFGQLIFEVSGRSSWVHVSLPAWNYETTRYLLGEVMDATVDAKGNATYKLVDNVAKVRGWHKP